MTKIPAAAYQAPKTSPNGPIPVPDEVQIDMEIRCWRCRRLLIEYAARPWSCKCGRCKAQNHSES